MNLKNIILKFKNLFNKTIKKLPTYQIIFFSFVILILIGSFFLMLPSANITGKSIPFIDALFISTSVISATSFNLYPLNTFWTLWGKVLISIFCQIGSLGIITIFLGGSVFTDKKITLKNKTMLQDSFGVTKLSGIQSLLRFVIVTTLLFEILGGIFLTIGFLFVSEFSFLEALGHGFFLSLSSFTNAGMVMFSEGTLIRFADNIYINIILIILILVGSLGFPLWLDFIRIFKSIKKHRKTKKHFFNMLSLTSKISIVTTIILTVIGTIFVFLVEFNNKNTIGNFSLKGKILSSILTSLSYRTTGYSSFDLNQVTSSTKFFSTLLMFIGGSPGGTTGGVKTVTFAVIILAVISILKSKEKIVVYGKSISVNVLKNSLAIIILNFSIAFITTIILCITENISHFEVFDIFYEALSATTTVGVSTGVVNHITIFGKLTMIICMLVGRIGSITFILSLSKKNTDSSILYPEEKIMIG